MGLVRCDPYFIERASIDVDVVKMRAVWAPLLEIAIE